MGTGTARDGRVRRGARRGLAALVLAGVAVLGGAVLPAPSASAAPSATVEIRDLTPPLVSVDPGGEVAFVNRIEPRTVQVGGGGLLPSLVTAQVFTDVTLQTPSGTHPLPRDAEHRERFDRTCVFPQCAITYTYRVVVPDTSVAGSLLTRVTTQALGRLPQDQPVTVDGRQTQVQIGVPTPFVVNTLLPLPDLPSVGLPQLPAVDVPLPQPPVPGTPQPEAAPEAPAPAAAAPAARGVDGEPYGYDLGGAAAAMAPVGDAVAAAPGLPAASSGGGAAGAPGAGAGGLPGNHDGVPVPVSGDLRGLDGTAIDEESSTVTADGPPPAVGLPLPALLAVVALAGATAALVRTHLALRAPGGRRP
ncbi:hypothetical protein [Geodermatophilus nigrescens]|uniref:Uncharacterized protein n=1 Tax=Geodermatophilus nigrescens TaxID=1070870 RepID=A0A1M5PYE4_9ACTN|nr:hypothetical protein [Geodermatophilus nigrescens]SHH06479.1 hypothetical protein SAMN05444351_3902 [Geodermatophilus nigrescens]